MRRSFLAAVVPVLAPVLAFAAVTFGETKKAHAGPHLDLDFDLGTAFQTRAGQSAVDLSGGLGVRLGYRFQFIGAPVYIQPEIGGKYMNFGFNSSNLKGSYDYAGIVNAGLKFGLTGVVQPNVFAHIGFGDMGYLDAYGNATPAVLGPTADLGIGLDFRLLPCWTLGAQVAYNTMLVPPDPGANDIYGAAKWVSFGITTGFHFGEPRPRPVYVQPVYYRRY
jgi:hypothetical protein